MSTTGQSGGTESRNLKHGRGGEGVVRRNPMNHEGLSGLEQKEKAFALAVAVMQEHIRSLPMEDRTDLMEVIPYLFCDDAEEVAAAQKAVDVILSQKKATVMDEASIVMPEEAMKGWLEYISRQIRGARKAAGMTQDELAESSGLPQSHICRLENGQHSPTNKTLTKIADALGITLADLDPGESRQNV